jgi:hypothetical protein
MKNHRCYVCRRIDKESKLVRAIFTKDQDSKWGHWLCFDDCNKDLVAMGDPWRWKIYAPNHPDHRAGSGASPCWAIEPKDQSGQKGDGILPGNLADVTI